MTNGGTTPIYQWKKNGTVIGGANNSTYTDPALVNLDAITCEVTSNVICPVGSPAASNTITMNVAPLIPSVSISAYPGNVVCPSTTVTFTAITTTGGTHPTYQWMKNGLPLSNDTNSTYSTSALANLDVIKCVMTSSLACASPATDTSNSVTMTVSNSLPVSVNITPSDNNICSGTSVTFTATPVNGGANPKYQWLNNGSILIGDTNSTFTTSTLSNLDEIKCVLTSSITCFIVNPDTSNTISMQVNPSHPLSVSIAAVPSGAICSGTSVKFTASVTNGGSAPIYQWMNNGFIIGGANDSTYTSASLADSDKITCVVTSNASCLISNPGISNTITMVVGPPLLANVSISAAPSGSICPGTSVTFTASTITGGTSPRYQWMKNGSVLSGDTNSIYTTTALVNHDKITCVMTSSLVDCITGNPATSNQITMTVNSNLPASVSITPSANNICSGTSVTFTASPVNGGHTPSYQWEINGSAISGATSYRYITSSLADQDQITCLLYSNANCPTPNPATSNTVTMSVGNPVTASLVLNANPSGPICLGTSVTFTATPTNQGSAPGYIWLKNNTVISGETNSTYISSSLADGDNIKCQMTSSAPCVSGSPCAASINMEVVTPDTANVIISANPSGPICAGTSVTFRAAPVNGGIAPLYQWRKNGTDIPGENDTVFTSSTLVNGDVITCVMTSDETCISGSPATSGTITMKVNNNLPVSVNITPSANNICSGTSVTYTAMPTHGGTIPSYQWQVNGSNAGCNSDSYTYTPANNDAVICILTSNATCATGSPATSNIINMAVNTTPVAGITNNTGSTTLSCTTTSISVTATGGTTYAWSGGSSLNTASNTLTAPATYTVTVTGANGCTVTAGITINQDIAAPASAITNNTGSTTLTCSTTSISVTATGGTTYAWSGGSSLNTASNTLTAPATYTVTVTGVNGCTATAGITISQDIAAPAAAITNNTGSITLTCSTTSISVTATGGTSYAWSGGNTPTTASNTLTTPATYTVTVTGANGCTATAGITISQDIAAPAAGITNNTGSDSLTCTTTSISVTATGGIIYVWSGGSSLNTASNTLTAPAMYTVTVTGANGCTATAGILITQPTAMPVAGITNNTGSIILTCSTTSISVIATGGTSYAWSDGSSLNTASNTLTAPATYTVTVTGANGCTATAGIIINQDIAAPAATITNNTGSTTLTCSTTSISVIATGSTSYAWSDGSSLNTASNTLTAPATYTVTVTGANGCTATAGIIINQDIAAPAATITNNTGNTTLTCSTTSISVTASGGTSYAWSGGNTPTTASNTLTAPATYTVTVTGANGCTATAGITINQDIAAPASAITNNTGSTTLTCSTTSISVTATGGTTYAWSGGNTPTTASNTLTAPATYTVTVTGANGCTATAGITINQDIAAPASAITNNTGSTTLTCTTTSISVTATGGTTYAWSGGSSLNTASNTLTAPATYTVTVTGANGCSASASIGVTANNTPQTSGITNTTTGGITAFTCTTPVISVTATPAGASAYTWSGGSTPTTAANSFNTAGTYTVTVTGANGCSASASIGVTANNTPPTSGITNTTTGGITAFTCTTPAITVTATPAGASAYTWSGGSTPTTAANSLNTAGTYTVTVTGANGCSASASIGVTANNTPPTSGITNTTTGGITAFTCTIPAITVTATPAGASAYTWSGGSTPTTAANSFNTADTYTVTVTGANGCSASASIGITANNTPPTAGITNNTGTDILTCTTTSIKVKATPAGSTSYAWSGGSSPNFAIQYIYKSCHLYCNCYCLERMYGNSRH